MRNKVAAIATIALLALAAESARAQNVVGYNRITVPANSDVRLTVPFTQVIEGTFAVVTKTGSTVTVADTLVAGKYNNVSTAAYYVRFTSGNASGLWTTVTSNGVNGFTLADANVMNLVNVGDSFRVYKHHTLGSLFPIGMYNVSYTNGTGVLIYANNIASMGQNKAASKIASYSVAAGNKWVGSGVTNNTILVPETQFVLRNNASTVLTMTTFGAVPDYTVSMLIAPAGDLVIGSGYPMPVVLKNSGLGGVNQRSVSFYNNAATGQNKAASKIASYSVPGGNKWVGSGITGNELIAPSEVIMFRLPSTETGTIVTIPKPY